MGIELSKIGNNEVLQFECDDRRHEENISARKAWFCCGSEVNLRLAGECGWIERKGAWICPHCARQERHHGK
jgi:hypothetical protein